MLVDFLQTHVSTLFSVTLISTFKNDGVVQARSQNGIFRGVSENLRGNGFALGAISKQKRFLLPNFSDDQKKKKRSSRKEMLILTPNFSEDQN